MKDAPSYFTTWFLEAYTAKSFVVIPSLTFFSLYNVETGNAPLISVGKYCSPWLNSNIGLYASKSSARIVTSVSKSITIFCTHNCFSVVDNFNSKFPSVYGILISSNVSDVSGKTYDYIIKLVREYGKYPLDLGEFDEDIW